MKAIVSSAVLMGLVALAPQALAQTAKLVTDERTSVYAGPNDDYPRVATVPAKRTVQVYGCLPGRQWCDVWVNGVRGWVESDDLVYWRNNRGSDVQRYDSWYRYPTVTFSLGSYWDTNYRRQACGTGTGITTNADGAMTVVTGIMTGVGATIGTAVTITTVATAIGTITAE